MVANGKRRITRHYIMHVSLLHLNRLLEDDIPFKTELRVCLFEDEDLAQVAFRNALTHTDRRSLLCKLHLTLPSRNMPRAVSITYYLKLEHFICSNLLSVEKFWVSYLTEFSQCLTNPPEPRSKSFSVCQMLLSKHRLCEQFRESTGAPNESIVQNHSHKALLNAF